MALFVRDAIVDGERTCLRAVDGRIAEIGPALDAEPGDEAIDASGQALIGGLVNAHTHAAMTLFRGYADDLPLLEWLERHIWPVEARLDAEDVYWGTRLACVEMIRTGTTRFWDMYWYPEAVARAVEDAGLQAVVAAPLIDGTDPGAARDAADAAVGEVRAAGRNGVEAGFAPHAIYTVGDDSLRWVAERAGELRLPIQIHLSETEEEVRSCVAEHGVRPAEHLDRAGLLGPRTVLAHGVCLDEAELDLIAERGATIATNPVANMKLAVGAAFPYPAARERAIPVGLGTDGAGSNNSLDLLADAKHFALLQKHTAVDAAAVTAGEALEIAQGLRSALLGGSRVAVGEAADFLLVPLASPELLLGALDAGLVYAGAAVTTTVVAGRVLMRDRVIDGVDEILERARERARRLGLNG